LQAFLITIVFSAVLSVLIVTLAHKKQWFLNRHDLIGVQKFHHYPTPHVGGLAVFLSFCTGYFLLPNLQEDLLPLLLVSTPVFIVGLVEDLSAKISPLFRLVIIFVSLSTSFFFLDIGISSLDFVWADNLLSYSVVGLAFTLLVVGGAVNALNVVDGYNGLMSGYAMLASVAMTVVAYQLGDTLILQLNLLLIAAIAGFFLFNFPFGKLFMGDGGAYFIGFIFSMIGLVFVDRHDVLSNWFLLTLLMYPMYELLFSIYRRKIIHRTLASQPDDQHLHTLVHKLITVNNPQGDKVMNNSRTSPFLWALSLVSIVPAVFWYDDKFMLIGWIFVFMAIYTVIYHFVTHFEFRKTH
jgi:UDP-N-acetylmuramyl pentapeptide phosphotransferase/UDP-N-acetylglucosamine-1-phosphate transferase